MPLALIFNGYVIPNLLTIKRYLVDKFCERRSMIAGLLGHAILNLAFCIVCFVAKNTMFLTIVTFFFFPLTCYFQTFSEIVINKNNSAWYGKDERGMIAGM